MKPKAVIAVAWPISVLLAGALGSILGIRAGTEVGEATFYNERVRTFQVDVADVARQQTNARTRDALMATADLAGAMSDTRKYRVAREEFASRIRESQNKAIVAPGEARNRRNETEK